MLDRTNLTSGRAAVGTMHLMLKSALVQIHRLVVPLSVAPQLLLKRLTPYLICLD